MNRILAIFAIGLGLGGGFGFLAAASNSVSLGGHDHNSHGHEATAEEVHNHSHEDMVDLSIRSAPSLSIEVIEDPVSGWNLHVLTEAFRFAPENVGGPHVTNEGHAHVYVDGIKIARLYGNWLHIGSLPEKAEVSVTLNSNDHKTLGVDGKVISAAVVVSATR